MAGFLDEDRLSAGLKAGFFNEARVLTSTGSTNAYVSAAAMAGASAGLVVVSGHQSRGRGRFSRKWEAPPETALAVSVLVEPRRSLSDWGWLSLVVGMAAVDGIGLVSGLPAKLKWPNDVLVGERKLCGILSERIQPGGRDNAVLGFGVNVRLTASQLPVPTATSLLLEGSDADATDVAIAILNALASWYSSWDSGDSLIEPYLARSATVGREVAVHVGAPEPVRGLATGVDPDGCLLVDTAQGRRAFAAGDVVHLRPAE